METGQIEIYQSDVGTEVLVKLEKDTNTIGLHLKHIYQDWELDEEATSEDCPVVQLGVKERYEEP